MAEEIVNAGYLRDPETHEIFLPQTHESLVTGLDDKINTKINTLDGNATTVDSSTSSLDIINTVSETDGVISSTKKTLAEGTSGKITITAPTSGTNAGKIVIDHANTTPVYEQNTVSTTGYNTPKETDTLVVTGIVTDYGHVARVKVEPASNLIAADIKASVKRQDDSTWNYRETGGDITIGEDTARIPSLKGNTIVWNQLVDTSTSSVTLISAHKYYTVIGGTKSIQTGAGSATSVTGGTDIVIDLTKMFGTDEQIAAALGVPNLTDATNLTKAAENFEKLFPNSYYPYCEGRLVNLGGYGVKWNQLYDTTVPTAVTNHKYYLSEVVSSTKTSSISTTISYTSGSTNRMCIDLTMMFGSGSEPTLEEFEAMFPDDYYEYNAGTEMNIFDAIGDKKLGLISTGDIPDESEPHAVDMGLPSGLLWAARDLDLTKPGGFCDTPFTYDKSFFSWGNIDGHNPKNNSFAGVYNWGSVNAAEPWYDGQPYGNTKGNTLAGNIPVGEEFDAARANLGSPWRMPTTAEFAELFAGSIYIDATGTEIPAATTDKRVTVNGIVGLYLQSKANGNRLFFSASGYGNGSSWGGSGNSGYYWSASSSSSRNARNLVFTSGGVYPQDYNLRYTGFAVRPVRYKKQTLDLDWIREIEYTPDGSSTPEKLFPYGLLSAGSVHDEVTEIKAIKRIDIRDYQSGDESDSTVITDGNKTHYALSVPKEIPLDQPHIMSYVVDDHGTEQQIPINVSSVINAPFRGTFEYMSNFKEGVLDLMGRFNDFTPTTKIIPDSATANSTLPTSQAVIDYMRAGGNGVKPVYESGDEVTPTTDVHAGLKTEVGNNSYKYYKIPFSAVTNDLSTGTSQVQIILNGNFS